MQPNISLQKGKSSIGRHMDSLDGLNLMPCGFGNSSFLDVFCLAGSTFLIVISKPFKLAMPDYGFHSSLNLKAIVVQ